MGLEAPAPELGGLREHDDIRGLALHSVHLRDCRAGSNHIYNSNRRVYYQYGQTARTNRI